MTGTASVTLPPGTYQIPQVVVLSAPASGTLYYTQDGSTPRPSAQVGYAGTAAVRVTDSQTLNTLIVDSTGTGVLAAFTYSIVRQGVNVPAVRPSSRTVDIRSMAFGLSGPIPSYPVYQFSGYRTKWERDRHNPFNSVPPYI